MVGLHPNDRNLGGWLAKKHNYMSWMLSSLQLSLYYEDIELVTDEAGYDLLINKLQLPYTSMRVELDCLNEYHSDLWALGKIYAYRLQEKPFLHVDGDVFIWNRFPKELESATLAAQNLEIDEPGYAEVDEYVQKHFDFVPAILHPAREKITSVNAGIFGGSNIKFFQDYTALVFKFIDKNLNKTIGLDIGAFNMYYEQYLFYRLVEEQNVPIDFLINDQRQLVDRHVNFLGIPTNSNYLHTVGTFKKRKETGKFLEHTLRSTYPNQYFYLMDLLVSHEV